MTYNHFLILANSDALSLDNLNIMQTAKNLVLDLEFGSHAELGTLLYLEWLVLQSLLTALLGQIDNDGWSSFGIELQREDDAVAGVVGVRKVLARATEAQ